MRERRRDGEIDGYKHRERVLVGAGERGRIRERQIEG